GRGGLGPAGGARAGLVAVLGARARPRARKALVGAAVAASERARGDHSHEADADQPDGALDEPRAHSATARSRSPNASRTSRSKSAGSVPSGPANSRR